VGGGIVLLAVGVRVVFLLQMMETPFFLHHFSDTRLYMQLAQDIAFGDGIPRAFFMSPLYPQLVAAVWKLTGNPELWMRILQVFFGAGTVAITMRIAERMFGGWSAVAAGIGAALYAPLIFYDGLLLTESLQTLLLTLHLFFLLTALQRSQWRWWIAAGMTLGLAGITRANVLLFLPVFVLLWMFATQWRGRSSIGHVIVYGAATLVMLLPTTLHNAAREGVFLPVTASFGYNLYAGNNLEADGFYTMPEPVDLYTDPNGAAWVQQHTGREMNATEISAWWRDRALTWMQTHPGDAVSLFLRKVVLFFHPVEIDQLGLSMAFFTEHYGAIPGIPSQLFPVLLILSCAGALPLIRQKDSGWLLPVFLLTFVVANALFFVSGRLRVPVLPMMMIAAAGGVTMVLRIWRERSRDTHAVRTLAAGGVLLGVLLLVVQPPVQQSYAQEYLKMGQIAFEQGSFAVAERRFRASLAEKPTVDGLTNLGNALAAQGRTQEATDMYHAALARDSTAALTWFNLGNLFMQTGSPRRAYAAWEKTLEHQPHLAAAHRNLGLLLYQAGRLEEALRHLETYITLERDTKKRDEVSRDVAGIRAALDRKD